MVDESEEKSLFFEGSGVKPAAAKRAAMAAPLVGMLLGGSGTGAAIYQFDLCGSKTKDETIERLYSERDNCALRIEKLLKNQGIDISIEEAGP